MVPRIAGLDDRADPRGRLLFPANHQILERRPTVKRSAAFVLRHGREIAAVLNKTAEQRFDNFHRREREPDEMQSVRVVWSDRDAVTGNDRAVVELLVHAVYG